MDPLDSRRADLEYMIDKAHREVFHGLVDPVKIAAAMQREADTNKSALGDGRVLVPNNFTVELSPSDHDSLSLIVPMDNFAQSLAQIQAEVVGLQGWMVYGDVIVAIDQNDDLERGFFRIVSEVHATPFDASEEEDAASTPPTADTAEAPGHALMSAATVSALRLSMLVDTWIAQRRLINALWGRVDRIQQRLDDTRPQAQHTGPDPIDWFSLTGAEREKTLEELGEFAEALVLRYNLQQEILPC